MAAANGCYVDTIKNGFVVTSSCHVYKSNTYCRYYCHDGYVKTASTVYCAGNDKWVPSGSHPSEDSPACRRSTDPVSGCDNIFFENGYVVTCPVSGSGTKIDCMYKCDQGYKPASTSVRCVRDKWVTTDGYGDPCIRDGSAMETTTMANRPAVSTISSPRTTYPGYYDDPNLKMDVNPVIFVGAVIGGFIVLGLLIFTIFFRAHKKSTRNARMRSAFIAACDPLSMQNDYSNDNTGIPADDSEFRDIARRIMSQSSNQPQQNSFSPPPYDERSSNINPSNQPTLSGPSSPPYSAVPVPVTRIPETLSPSAPPYLATCNSGTAFQQASPFQLYDQMQSQQINGTTVVAPDRTANAVTDKPPPYEVLQFQAPDETDSRRYGKDTADEGSCENFDPPPPYTTHENKV